MRKILIVDDEPDIRALLRIVFESAGFDVTEAADGVEALNACLEIEPNVVLTDLLMPNMDGAELISALMHNGIRSEMIVMSGGNLGVSPKSEIEKITAMGVSKIIDKPFDPAEVLAACSDPVGNHQSK